MNAEEVKALLAKPESEQLEFKVGPVRPEIVSRVLGAFANTRGGTLIWGYDERKGMVVGVDDPEKAERAVRNGLSGIRPQPDAAIERVDVDGLPVIVAQVGRTPGHLYVANRELLERRGDRDEMMSAARLAQLAGVAPGPGSGTFPGADDATAENNKALIEAIAGLQGDMADLKKQNSLRRRALIALGGATFGALLRPIIDLFS